MKTSFYLALITVSLISLTNQRNPKKGIKEFESLFKPIPSGYLYEENDSILVQSFCISTTEIMNNEYLLFLADLKKQGRLEDLKIAEIDTMKWVSGPGFSEKMAEHYHDHLAYKGYPVVNITKEGAILYCEWLSSYWNKKSDGSIKVKFRLPEHVEWKYAASGGIKKAKYAWNGSYLRNSKGIILANFVNLDASAIGRDSLGNFVVHFDESRSFDPRNADVLAPVNSYYPNNFGLYNMNGNAAELVADKNVVAGGSWRDPGFDIQNISTKPYKGASSTIGFRVAATYVK